MTKLAPRILVLEDESFVRALIVDALSEADSRLMRHAIPMKR